MKLPLSLKFAEDKIDNSDAGGLVSNAPPPEATSEPEVKEPAAQEIPLSTQEPAQETGRNILDPESFEAKAPEMADYADRIWEDIRQHLLVLKAAQDSNPFDPSNFEGQMQLMVRCMALLFDCSKLKIDLNSKELEDPLWLRKQPFSTVSEFLKQRGSDRSFGRLYPQFFQGGVPQAYCDILFNILKKSNNVYFVFIMEVNKLYNSFNDRAKIIRPIEPEALAVANKTLKEQNVQISKKFFQPYKKMYGNTDFDLMGANANLCRQVFLRAGFKQYGNIFEPPETKQIKANTVDELLLGLKEVYLKNVKNACLNTDLIDFISDYDDSIPLSSAFYRECSSFEDLATITSPSTIKDLPMEQFNSIYSSLKDASQKTVKDRCFHEYVQTEHENSLDLQSVQIKKVEDFDYVKFYNSLKSYQEKVIRGANKDFKISEKSAFQHISYVLLSIQHAFSGPKYGLFSARGAEQGLGNAITSLALNPFRKPDNSIDYDKCAEFSLNSMMAAPDFGQGFEWGAVTNVFATNGKSMKTSSDINFAKWLSDLYHNNDILSLDAQSRKQIETFIVNHPSINKSGDVEALGKIFSAYISLKSYLLKNNIPIDSLSSLNIDEKTVNLSQQFIKEIEILEPISISSEKINDLLQKSRSVVILKEMLDSEEVRVLMSKAKPKLKEVVADPNWSQPNFRFRVFEDKSFEHLKVGAETNCCQTIGGVGEDAAIDSLINPTAGVIVLEVSSGGSWSLVAQSYFHFVEDPKMYILDNVECVKGNIEFAQYLCFGVTNQSIENLYEKWAQHLMSSIQGLTSIRLGLQYTKIDTKRFKKDKLNEDPRYFEHEEQYSDFDYHDHVNLAELSNTASSLKEHDSDDNEPLSEAIDLPTTNASFDQYATFLRQFLFAYLKPRGVKVKPGASLESLEAALQQLKKRALWSRMKVKLGERFKVYAQKLI
jgi:hypothetical protein